MRALEKTNVIRLARVAAATMVVTVTALAASAIAASAVGFGALGVAASILEPVVVTGQLNRLDIETAGHGQAPGGIIEINNVRISIPPGLNIDLPATTLTLPVLFAMAQPACRLVNESGLARADRCRADPAGTGPVAEIVDTTPRSGLAPKPDFLAPVAVATVSASRGEDGRLTATAVALSKNVEHVWGAVSYIDTEHGYFRVNGPFRQDEGGMLVRLNDPLGYQAVQSGVACGADGNCSPDARFRIDTAHVSVRFRRGNPACVPSNTVPSICPDANRSVPADDTVSPVPLKIGDHVKALGAFEVAGGVRFFSAQTLAVDDNPAMAR